MSSISKYNSYASNFLSVSGSSVKWIWKSYGQTVRFSIKPGDHSNWWNWRSKLDSNTGLAKRLVAKLSFCLYFYKTFFSWRLTQLVNLVQFTLVGLEDKVSSKGTLTKKKTFTRFWSLSGLSESVKNLFSISNVE